VSRRLYSHAKIVLAREFNRGLGNASAIIGRTGFALLT
jgi:hypothetical protein